MESLYQIGINYPKLESLCISGDLHIHVVTQKASAETKAMLPSGTEAPALWDETHRWRWVKSVANSMTPNVAGGDNQLSQLLAILRQLLVKVDSH